MDITDALVASFAPRGGSWVDQDNAAVFGSALRFLHVEQGLPWSATQAALRNIVEAVARDVESRKV